MTFVGDELTLVGDEITFFEDGLIFVGMTGPLWRMN